MSDLVTGLRYGSGMTAGAERTSAVERDSSRTSWLLLVASQAEEHLRMLPVELLGPGARILLMIPESESLSHRLRPLPTPDQESARVLTGLRGGGRPPAQTRLPLIAAVEEGTKTK